MVSSPLRNNNGKDHLVYKQYQCLSTNTSRQHFESIKLGPPISSYVSDTTDVLWCHPCPTIRRVHSAYISTAKDRCQANKLYTAQILCSRTH